MQPPPVAVSSEHFDEHEHWRKMFGALGERPGLIMRCLTFVGKPVDVRAGLHSKERVATIINTSCLEMDEIEKENEAHGKPKL